MSKETLTGLIEDLEEFRKIGDEQKDFLQGKVMRFGTYIADVGERIPTRDRGGEIDTQGRFFAALHELLDLLIEEDIPEETLGKIIDLAGREIGARYNPAYEIKEGPEGLIFEERSTRRR